MLDLVIDAKELKVPYVLVCSEDIREFNLALGDLYRIGYRMTQPIGKDGEVYWTGMTHKDAMLTKS